MFPYNTARTINTSAYLGELGLPPGVVDQVYLVIKPYLSVVAKDGPLKEEIKDPKLLEELIGHGGETGSISGRPRRVGKFDFDSFRKTIDMSGATQIAISHLDLSKEAWNAIGFDNDLHFLGMIDQVCWDTYSQPDIELLSYGPTDKDVITFYDWLMKEK
jgi:adenylosuccinate synthase